MNAQSLGLRDAPEPFTKEELVATSEWESGVGQPPATESSDRPEKRTGRSRAWRVTRLVLLVLTTASMAYFVIDGARPRNGVSAAAPQSATLRVESEPAGVEIFLDGIARGRTPDTLVTPPGPHVLELRGTGLPRVFPLKLTPGASITHFVELSAAPSAGSLDVQSDADRAEVTIDDVAWGTTPILVTELAPGEHQVVVRGAGTAVRRTVTIQPGVTTSVMVPLISSASPDYGRVRVEAPFELKIFEMGRLLGTTEVDQLVMAAGDHRLEFTAPAFGFREERFVPVKPGAVTTIRLELPQGTVNLNALPWAEVWIDDKRAGETPLGNLQVPIGPHEFIFKNPEHGERRQVATVTLLKPTHVSVNFTQ